RASGCTAGRTPLHGAAILVLPDPAVPCRRPAAGRPLCRRQGTIRARAPSRAGQWLVVLRAGGAAQGTRRRRGGAQGRGGPCQNLDRRPQTVADFESLTLTSVVCGDA